MATVPDTTTFSLQDVVNVVGGTGLVAAHNNAVNGAFDPTYKGSQNQLDDFRNYDDSYDPTWGGYIQWSFDGFTGTDLYFLPYNCSSVRNAQSSTISLETRMGGSVVWSGSLGSGSIDAGYGNSVSIGYSGAFDAVWGNSGGGWQQLY
jgi:hypothetical protein